MKVLTVNSTYKEFSTGKIINDIETELSPLGYSFVHCYEFGDKHDDNNAYRLSGKIEFRVYYKMARFIGLQYGMMGFSNLRLLYRIWKEKPDIVHIHCPNALSINLYKLLNYLKKRKIRTIITNHAEFFYTGNCAHANECTGYLTGCKKCEIFKEAGKSLLFNRTAEAWLKMKRAFADYKYLRMVAVSPWAEERLSGSTICKHLPHCTILNGIDTEKVFYPRDPEEGNCYKQRQEQKILLHVTSRFTDDESDPKGGIYLLKLAQYFKEMHLDYKILVVGPCCLKKNYDYLENISFLGYLNDQVQLAGLYSMADLTIVTSKRETFGLSCVESMCCGTPVVGFMSGGTESIALREYSEFVEFGDVESLKSVVVDWSDKKPDVTSEIARTAARLYSKKTMAENYRKLYEELIHEE